MYVLQDQEQLEGATGSWDECVTSKPSDLDMHIDLANNICKQCQDNIHIPGTRKLLKKCQAELKFLKGVSPLMICLI